MTATTGRRLPMPHARPSTRTSGTAAPGNGDGGPWDPAEPLATARGLTKRYGLRPALAGVDLDVVPGVTGLLGRNGAGKTTLLRCLATDLDPGGGELRVLGASPQTAAGRTRIRRGIGHLPQNPALYPHFTAFSLVDYVAVLKEVGGRRARHDEVRRVLDAVGLYGRRHSRVRRLSGGMRQRLALACALLGDPRLLLLDEPTIGLDPEQRIRFRDLVSEFTRDRGAVLSTHQIEDVSALCSRVLVLDEGRLAFDGTPGELTAHARGRVWSVPCRPEGASTAWRGPDGRYRALTPEAAAPPEGCADARPVEPTLEDGYLLFTAERR